MDALIGARKDAFERPHGFAKERPSPRGLPFPRGYRRMRAAHLREGRATANEAGILGCGRQ
jgi:hypothetical protein